MQDIDIEPSYLTVMIIIGVLFTSILQQLKRELELEEQNKASNDAKALRLLEEIQEQAEAQKKLREEALSEIIEANRAEIEGLVEENLQLQKKIAKLEQRILELKETRSQADDWKEKLKQVLLLDYIFLDPAHLCMTPVVPV